MITFDTDEKKAISTSSPSKRPMTSVASSDSDFSYMPDLLLAPHCDQLCSNPSIYQ